ncbi:MAG TPA: primosomal protein N', partial [Bacteroides sp.]|nr:primosomal protein N' [Bacteroides sp.]
MGKSDLFARVILPLAVEGTFTYSVPGGLVDKISAGSRVLVSFGKKRIYTAIVQSLDSTPPEDFTPKPIMELLDPGPMVTGHQLRLWEWMSAYYLCTPGEVMRAALPSGLRPESESRVRINRSFDGGSRLDSQERLLYEVVKDQGEVTLGDLQIAGVGRDPAGILKQLVEKGAVEINEFV